MNNILYLSKLAGLAVLTVLTTGLPVALADRYTSPNYTLGNANLGEQPFITAREISPPAVTGPGPEVITLTPYSATIKWFTDKSANSIVAYGSQSGIYAQEISKASEYVLTHEVEIVGLTPKTTYYFQAKSTDLYGNQGVSDERRFTTPLPQPKITSVKVGDITSEAATISFKTDYFTTAVVEYINLTTLAKKTVGESGYSKTHTINLTDLRDDQSYTYRIIARDDEGNENSTATATFKTDKDRVAPTVDNVKFDVGPITGKDKAKVTVSWKTNEPATSQVNFGESNDPSTVSQTELDNNLTTNHIVTIPNLKPQTTYRLTIFSADQTGNMRQTDDYLILTPKQRRSIFDIVLENLEDIFKPFSGMFK